MNDQSIIIEIEDTNPTEMILDEKHPGINDKDYVTRRQFFFDVSREHRLAGKHPTNINYNSDEEAVWQHVSSKLHDGHNQHAADFYLEGKRLLSINPEKIPHCQQLSKGTFERTGFCLTPAEGLIDMRSFFHYLARKIMPCTLFIRHSQNPEYTPEPDAVHDMIGHIPPLMNQEYVELVQLIGEGVNKATDEELTYWQRLYWFTLEFGLIEQGDNLKAFGAGLLSSYGELQYCFSDNVTRKPFDLEEIIHTDFDGTVMQNNIFIIQSLSQLKKAVSSFINK